MKVYDSAQVHFMFKSTRYKLGKELCFSCLPLQSHHKSQRVDGLTARMQCNIRSEQGRQALPAGDRLVAVGLVAAVRLDGVRQVHQVAVDGEMMGAGRHECKAEEHECTNQ